MNILFGTAKEASKHYNVHPQTLLKWAKKGRIRYRMGLGGRNRQYELVANDPKTYESEVQPKEQAAAK